MLSGRRIPRLPSGRLLVLPEIPDTSAQKIPPPDACQEKTWADSVGNNFAGGRPDLRDILSGPLIPTPIALITFSHYNQRMKHFIFETKFGVLLQILLFATPFIIPLWKLNIDIPTFLTLMSLFFTILIGFFIASAAANYLRMQTLMTNEDANLVAIYYYARLIQPNSVPDVAAAIDDYMISALDFNKLDYAGSTVHKIEKILKTVDDIHPSNEEGLALLPYLHTVKNNIIALNREFALLSKEVVQARHWFIITILAIFISLLLLALRTDSYFSSFLTGSLLIVIYQTLDLLHEIDSNLFLAKHIAYEDPQYVFTAIGKLPYYPETAVKMIKQFPPAYRVGVYKNYPRSYEKEVREFKKG
jgi:hypothetical protein